MLAALRGMFRPLTGAAVALRIDEAPAAVFIRSDEAKLSQILRNFISNALKFTERGDVRVKVSVQGDEQVIFSVSDSGIGIAPEDQQRIFDDFAQVDGPIQRRVRGTGLGLPLTRKLATLLRGEVWVQSEVGAGSTFFLRVPRRCPPPDATVNAGEAI
jgi:signal transduction histidine kinase